MTERDKIIEVIDEWANKAVKANKFDGASVYNPHNAAELADKLIEAGFGYVKDLKAELRSKVDYIHAQDEVIKDYKHRAGVAEVFLALIGYQLKKMKHRAEVAERACRIATDKVYDYCYEEAIEQAERELAEEKKDDTE